MYHRSVRERIGEAEIEIMATSVNETSLDTIISRAKQLAQRMVDDGRSGTDSATWGTGSMTFRVTFPEE